MDSWRLDRYANKMFSCMLSQSSWWSLKSFCSWDFSGWLNLIKPIQLWVICTYICMLKTSEILQRIYKLVAEFPSLVWHNISWRHPCQRIILWRKAYAAMCVASLLFWWTWYNINFHSCLLEVQLGRYQPYSRYLMLELGTVLMLVCWIWILYTSYQTSHWFIWKYT